MECDLNLCKEHIVQRVMNVDTGSYNDLSQLLTKKRLAIHPLDKISVVEAEVNKNLNVSSRCFVCFLLAYVFL